jgi:5-methylcytosine-specific restriction endonuclease McrA
MIRLGQCSVCHAQVASGERGPIPRFCSSCVPDRNSYPRPPSRTTGRTFRCEMCDHEVIVANLPRHSRQSRRFCSRQCLDTFTWPVNRVSVCRNPECRFIIGGPMRGRGALCSDCRRERQRLHDIEWISTDDRQFFYDMYVLCAMPNCLCPDGRQIQGTGNGRWAASIDHIVPRSLDGTHDWTNLRMAHRACNQDDYIRNHRARRPSDTPRLGESCYAD